MSFDIKIRLHGGPEAEAGIDKVTAALKKAESATEKALVDFEETERAMKMISLNAPPAASSLGKLQSALRGVGGGIRGGIDKAADFAKALGPVNQVAELAGKAMRFADAGLDAYAKTSSRAAEEVANLKAEFAGWRDTVLEGSGQVTVALLRSVDRAEDFVRKRQAFLDKYRKGGIGAFFDKPSDFMLGDDETRDPILALGSAWDGVKESIKGNVDYWNTDGQSFVDRFTTDLGKQKAAVDDFNASARLLEVEFDQINRALTGDRFGGGIKKGADDLKSSLEDLQRQFAKAAEENAKAAEDAHERAVESYFETQIELAEKSEEAVKKAREESEQFGRAFVPAKDALVDMFKEGELSADRLLEALDDIAIKLLEMALINAFSGNGGGAGFMRGLAGGRTGFDHMVSGRPGPELPGFAMGGDMLVGGAGAADSKLAAFWVTPGESIHVRTPEQRREATAAASGRTMVTVQLQENPRDIAFAMDSRRGERVTANIERRLRRRRR